MRHQTRRGHGERASRKQEQLIGALLLHPTVEQAAESVKIARATAYRWMQDPCFSKRYLAARRQIVDQAVAALQRATPEAVETLGKIQRESNSDSSRVMAARTVLEYAVRSLQLAEIEARLKALEERR